MSHNPASVGAERSGGHQPSVSLSRVDLAMLLSAERRLAAALARPAEVLRFFLLAVEETAALLKVERALLCLIDAEDPHLLRVMAGVGAMADEEGELLPIEGSFEGRVFRGPQAVRSGDLTVEPEAYRLRRNQRRGGPAVAVPLQIRGRPIGVLLAAREPGGAPFLERDAELLLEFSTPISAAIESMRQFDTARRSRESVEAWNREQKFRRWVTRYETVTGLRSELVFRLDSTGTMEWGGSTESLFGVDADHFAPRLEDFLGWLDPSDLDRIRSLLQAMMNPAGPTTVAAACTLRPVNGLLHHKKLQAWRLREGGDVLGVVSPATPGEGDPEEVSTESGAEGIVRSLRHQINNPLAAVIGRAQLLIREDIVQREPVLRQSVETILFESERINRFVQQLQNHDGLSRLTEPLPGEPGRGW